MIKGLFSAALHALCFKYNCIINTGMAFWNSLVVESLLYVWEVPGSILGQVYFLFADSCLLQLQYLSSVVPAELITCCRCRAAYHFFIIGQKTFMQCYTVALHKRLVSAPVHAGSVGGAFNFSYPDFSYLYTYKCKAGTCDHAIGFQMIYGSIFVFLVFPYVIENITITAGYTNIPSWSSCYVWTWTERH